MTKYLILIIAAVTGCGGVVPSPAPVEETTLVHHNTTFQIQPDTELSPPHETTEVSPPREAATIETSARANAAAMTQNGDIYRHSLNRLLAKGPSALLALVVTEPYRSAGKFQGFKIVAFKTELPPSLDLRIGDVVKAINGLKIIMPDDYFRVFQELKVAGEIRIELIRDKKRVEKTYPIIE